MDFRKAASWLGGGVVAGALGCSSTNGGGGSVDAGHDVRTSAESGDGSTALDSTPPDSSPPSATSLAVAPLTLVPAFSVDVHDYYVRCASGTNALTVTLTAAVGSTVSLSAPVTTMPSRESTTRVTLTENEALVAGVKTGATTDAYWVRCLPHDFPQIQMNLHPDAGTPTPGYYLAGNVLSVLGSGGYAMVVDGNGVPVWYHTAQGGLDAVDVENVVPGAISYIPYFDYSYANVSGKAEVHDLSAGVTTYVEPVGVPLDIHELRLLSNGDYLVLAVPIITGVDLTGLETYGPNEDVIGCVIQEVSPSGTNVWQWNITDHFDAVKNSTWPQTDSVDGKTVIDPFHCNSLDVDSSGNLLVSARHMDSIFLVSRATGAVLWKLGGTPYSVDNAPYLEVQGDTFTTFYRQHDVRFLPDGNLSLFDDQTDKTNPARALVLSYDVTAGTAAVVWQSASTVPSLSMGSFRILADGSRVVGWGVGGAPDRAFSEVDVNGNDLLDFAFTQGDATYRAVKVPLTEFDIGLLRSTAGAED